jgi:hypothetical protein
MGPERKVKCYNGYFVNGYIFHIEEYGHGRKTYNNGVCIKGSTSSEFEVDYYGRLEEVMELVVTPFWTSRAGDGVYLF